MSTGQFYFLLNSLYYTDGVGFFLLCEQSLYVFFVNKICTINFELVHLNQSIRTSKNILFHCISDSDSLGTFINRMGSFMIFLFTVNRTSFWKFLSIGSTSIALRRIRTKHLNKHGRKNEICVCCQLKVFSKVRLSRIRHVGKCIFF